MESKNRTVWIFVAIVLVAACCCVVLVAAIGMGWLATGPDTLDLGGLHREQLERTFKVSDAPQLNIATFAGEITIRAGADDAIHVTATKRAVNRNNLDRIQLDMSSQGNGVRIEARLPGNRSNSAVDLEITAPTGTRVELSSGAGDLEVSGLRGPLTVDLGAGVANIRDVSGMLDVDSGAGDIDVRRSTGPVRLFLGAGQITYEGNPVGDCRFQTGAGNVDLKLPRELNMRLDLSTGIGSIDVDYDVAGSVRSREVQGLVGDGSGGTLDAHSGAGLIRLRPRQ
ncbi:MAG: DUF4097 family beta strand repeat-containing protein [Anaerolineae bacterium]|jgi:hypothetical protein